MICANVRCAQTLDGGYHVDRVNAVEQNWQTAPDGSGISTVPRAVVTCSWACLVIVATEQANLVKSLAGLADARRDEEPF